MAYVDFHVHIDYYKDFINIYNEYENRKIYTLFVTNLPEIYEATKLKLPESKYIKVGIGYNPMMVGVQRFNKSLFDKYVLTTDYIGEIGLDYSKEYLQYKTEQLEIFEYIIKNISGTNKFISIHSRNSIEDVISILDKYEIDNAVFHWYTGSIEMIKEIVDRGYYFSINPAMLKNKKGRNILNQIPLSRIIFESDGPFTKFKNIVMHPRHIEDAYTEFGNFYEINDFRKLVIENFKDLISRK